MIKVLLCGEGPHDVGHNGDWGWLQMITKRLINRRLAFSKRSRAELVLLPKDEKKYKPFPPGHGRRALLAKRIAVNEGYDVVIFMADADTNKVREWREKHQQIIAGFKRIDNVLASIACLPMSASESWLLADHKAWKKLGLVEKADLPSHPEQIWGDKRDPNGNYPHRLFARVCAKAGVDDDRATRVEVASGIDLRVLVGKCPVSFAPFQDGLLEASSVLDDRP
jgi:hypothetical protein